MNILLFGAGGQVGWELQRSLAPLGRVIAAQRSGGDIDVDLGQPDAVRGAIASVAPDVVVNAAAYTAVDRAEDEPDAAFAVNATACEVMADLTRARGAWLVHYSSDYVYPGTGVQPWRESDTCAPLGAYGRSKLAGDHGVMRNPRHLIFRTSWVYGRRGGNFLKSILRAAVARDELSVVDDQWGAPTGAALIADVTAHALARTRRDDDTPAGLYHLAAAGETNWHAYARFVIATARACGLQTRCPPEQVRAVSTADYGARAPRPANSRLDTSRLQATFGLDLPPWETGVRTVIADVLQPPAVVGPSS